MRLRVAVVVASLASATSAAAQGPLGQPPDASRLAVTLPVDVLSDLPTAGHLFSILETIQAEVVVVGVTSGGLVAGRARHVATWLGSRGQTHYRIGDLDIASPYDGTPLLLPDIALWKQVEIATGLMPVSVNTPALAISLEPHQPASRWTGVAEGFASSPRLVSRTTSDGPPPIARLHGWSRGMVLVNGPIGHRSGVVIGAAIREREALARRQSQPDHEDARSAFAQLTFNPVAEYRVQTSGWFESVRGRSAHATSSESLSARDSSMHAHGCPTRKRGSTSSSPSWGGPK